MFQFFRLCQAELIKIKNTPVVAMSFLTPLMVTAMITLVDITQAKDVPIIWEKYYENVVILWLEMMLQLHVGVQTALYTALEHDANAWKLLFTAPASRLSIYGAKLTISLLLMALSYAVLFGSLYLGAAVLQAFRPDSHILSESYHAARLVQIITAGAGATIGIVVLQTYLAIKSRSMAVPIIAAVGGFIFTALSVGRTVFQHISPWSQPYNTFLQLTHSPLAKTSLLYALASSIAVGIAVFVIFRIQLAKQDVK